MPTYGSSVRFRRHKSFVRVISQEGDVCQAGNSHSPPLYPAPSFPQVRRGSSEQGSDLADATQYVGNRGPGCGSRTIPFCAFDSFRHISKSSLSKGLGKHCTLGDDYKMDVKLSYTCHL